MELKPDEQWRTGMTQDRLLHEFEQRMASIPGIEPSFSQPIRDNVLESISQIKGQVVIKVQGDDLSAIERIAREIRQQVDGVEGVSSSFVDRDGQLP